MDEIAHLQAAHRAAVEAKAEMHARSAERDAIVAEMSFRYKLRELAAMLGISVQRVGHIAARGNRPKRERGRPKKVAGDD